MNDTTVDERDAAQNAVDELCELVLGYTPEWSNLYGYTEALNDCAAKLEAERAAVMCDEQARNDDSEIDYDEEPPCSSCAGRGFDYDWIDQGGQMRAVPGSPCYYCNGSGSRTSP